MIVFPDAFGVRLEDHIFITADGPRHAGKQSLFL
ncbi:Xaa-Pro aminopeptidase [Rhizobium sp. BK176]|nr:Xaa-Pro aminopeptidase [Rhizobium sp. BK661]MCS4095142.1 Xaa-Pro aminopeptidase [Rhizobium sp. BK176]